MSNQYKRITLALGGLLTGLALLACGAPTQHSSNASTPQNASQPAPAVPTVTVTAPAPKPVVNVRTVVKVKTVVKWRTKYVTRTVVEYRDRPAKPSRPRPTTEDSPGWDCRTRGNHVCGPGGSKFRAGCYRDGVLVVPWTNYADPRKDPLWGQLTPPC